MRDIRISTGKRSSYRVAFDSIGDLGKLIQNELSGQVSRCLLVTDDNVDGLYGDRGRSALDGASIESFTVTVRPGEESKSLDVLSDIYGWALGQSVDRKTPLVALGGGVVGDLAGFAAATLLRGIPLIHVPTSLTAQVDSSIGGKTGINHPCGKNLIGAFYPPSLVVTDTSLLSTLPEHEWRSGMAEVVKHALIAGPEQTGQLERDWSNLIDRKAATVDHWIPMSAAVKAQIVEDDERESDKRMWLNLGHTTGHAIERVGGYGSFSHGEAVAFGLALAVEWSNMNGRTVETDLATRLLLAMDIRAKIHALSPVKIFEATDTDKKRTSSSQRFVMLKCVGEPYVETGVNQDSFCRAWDLALGQLS